MARLTSSKRGRGRRAFTRRMGPRAGRISPPVDVRSTKDIPRALNLLKKGPMTLVFIYADWCGHCHNFKPKYNNAVRAPNRNIQAIQVNDAMVSDFNSALESEIVGAKPLAPEGYPEILLINTNGKPVGNVPPSATEMELVNVVTNANNVPAQASPATAATVRNANVQNANVRTNMAPTIRPSRTPSANLRKSNSRPANSVSSEPSYLPDGLDTPTIVNSGPGSVIPSSSNTVRMINALSTPPKPVLPSNARGDIIEEFQNTPLVPIRQGGGGLYGALSAATYHLAPAGILLAGLHVVRNRRSRRSKAKRSTRRQRSNRR